ncbi:MAG: YihA family ribosome biogenesis GTP-binding protein [Alphaproteobacteria bacterium]|nr:YihA family ribosome biogenesis GTP-binding protein [Alphaproteobacteria bacterium]MCA0452300.1 ribosome biogenesis GTP-binding protein YihA/YsxC [Pseudomonadota bacterium]
MADHETPGGDAAGPAGQGESLTPEAIEAARKLFVGPCEFIAGAATLDAVLPPKLPEVALAGRSNVGKSSLINALTNRGNTARVSKHPGRTQQLNFFSLSDRLSLVDMPGYGYAAVSKGTKLLWSELIGRYLKGRPTLRRALVLVDSRHGIKESDREVFKLLDTAAVNWQLVLTKCDALGTSGLKQRIAECAAEIAKRPAAHPVIVPTSSEKNIGIEQLRCELASLAKPA